MAARFFDIPAGAIEAAAFGNRAKLREPKRNDQAVCHFDGALLQLSYQGLTATAPASGHWPAPLHIPARFLYMLAQLPPPGDPVEILFKQGRFHVGSPSTTCLATVSEGDPLHLIVDKSAFLEAGRVFKNVYRPRAANVLFKLSHDLLRIEFYGGSCDLACETTRSLFAETTAAAFARLVSAHRFEKSLSGTIVLTFNPALRQLSTPLVDVKAKFHSPQFAPQ